MAERAGSILQMNEDLDTTVVFDQFLAAQRNGDPEAVRILDPLQLRYFSPSELLRLFRFDRPSLDGEPSLFQWPPKISTKTKYKLIGNSVNVAVVSRLIDYLFQ
ncbi:hypothetical protein PHLCEN_2v3583 [Hermanssonia centrifuga]|uniref:tRNA (cytosine(38)-C(5))-methyltransferase n=1 Tax=Hermanssonia centrifuga TaxID=98765 RepID=A0A2R6QET4_9APHY|nr:hypothetical protein PHLCEN_2v3583 [Hermanssonia centrifuga]